MALQTSFLKKLVKEDFDSKDQTLIGKIGFVLNPIIQQLTSILNKGLSIANLSTQVKTILVQMDATGKPASNLSFLSDLSGKCIGVTVLRAQNLTNSTTYPTGAPFITFSENNGQIQIAHITGLSANDTWQLTLVAYD